MRNTYTWYHICLMRVFILLLSIRYNVCVSVIIQYITTSPLLLSTSHVYTCHSPKYNYIIVTVVYLVYYSCIIAVCVSWFCDHRACISDEWSAWMLAITWGAKHAGRILFDTKRKCENSRVWPFEVRGMLLLDRSQA